MATSVSSRPTDEQFLGNSDTTEVHDLENEQTNCQIDELVDGGNGVVFTPDTLAQAHSEGFDNCHWCIGDSTR